MSLFPDHGYTDAALYAADYFQRVAAAAASVAPEDLRAANAMMADVVAAGGTIFSCGNGGSAAIANHLVCDCLKGVRADTDVSPRVHSLSTTVELITAIANDISYDEVFAFQLQSVARPGDMLIAISSSGNSPNVLKALVTARALGLRTLAMVGFSGGRAAELSDVRLWVREQNYGVVEDVHQSLMHIMAQYLRQANLSDMGLLGARAF